MANFPFKNATFTTYADFQIPVINYGEVYYTKINGVITAVKPIALGIYKPTDKKDSSWAMELRVYAADGKIYNLNMCGRRLFFSANDAIMYEKSTSSMYRSPIREKSIDEVFSRYGACRDFRSLKVYVWSSWGEAVAVDGGFIFWADKDGEHLEFMLVNENGSKLYLSKAECVNANVQVVDFTDDLPVPKGEYTVKREFTVKATSEEEAESIIDEAINKAYKEQFK